MKLTKEQKREVSRQLAQKFQGASLYFTQFQGLKFVELAQLRAKLKPLACKYQVVKNTLVGNALKEAGIQAADKSLLSGPVGLIVAPGTDPISAARTLGAFAKEFPLLKMKAAFVDGKWVDASGCAQLATMGTKPELLASLAGTLYAAVAQSAGVLSAPIRDFVLVLKAVQEKNAGSPEAKG